MAGQEQNTEDFTLDLDLDMQDVGDDGGSDGDQVQTKETKTTETTTTPETKDTTKAPEGPTLTEFEKRAYDQGWRPKEDFIKAGGDPAAWKDAGWWMDRGELLGQQAQLRKELKTIKDAFINMTKQSRDAYVKGQQDILNNMKIAKREAMKNQDFDTVADLDEKIEQQQVVVQTVEQQAKQPIVSQEERSVENSAVYQNWLRDNPWYTNDEELHAFANSTLAVRINKLKQNGETTSVEEALQYVSERIRTAFPDKFGGPRKVASPNIGGRSNQSSGGNTSSTSNSVDDRFNKIVSGMDIDTRKAVLDMVRSKVISKKEYVENYID